MLQWGTIYNYKSNPLYYGPQCPPLSYGQADLPEGYNLRANVMAGLPTLE